MYSYSSQPTLLQPWFEFIIITNTIHHHLHIAYHDVFQRWLNIVINQDELSRQPFCDFPSLVHDNNLREKSITISVFFLFLATQWTWRWQHQTLLSTNIILFISSQRVVNQVIYYLFFRKNTLQNKRKKERTCVVAYKWYKEIRWCSKLRKDSVKLTNTRHYTHNYPSILFSMMLQYGIIFYQCSVIMTERRVFFSLLICYRPHFWHLHDMMVGCGYTMSHPFLPSFLSPNPIQSKPSQAKPSQAKPIQFYHLFSFLFLFFLVLPFILSSPNFFLF